MYVILNYVVYLSVPSIPYLIGCVWEVEDLDVTVRRVRSASCFGVVIWQGRSV